MKIEVAESLIYSYLKHVEGCRIVQTNWKTSGKWNITEYDTEDAEKLFDKFKQNPNFEDIFKQSSFSQLIKQAEIDVLGLNTTENSIFGIDVAFHEAGLNYSGIDETANRVMKKILRTIFIMQSYFKDFNKFNSYFVTPKISKALEEKVTQLIKEASDILDDETISIRLITNNDFFNTIVNPVIVETKNESDTCELFIRTVKLLNLDTQKDKKTLTNKEKETSSDSIAKTTEDGMKIGQFVQYHLTKAFEDNLISEEEIIRLQDKEYSKKELNQNFEVLRSSDKETTDEGGKNRYYTKSKFCGNYYLTSQWFEYHWIPFKKWLKKIEKEYQTR
jgi:hypothetical protein